MPQGSAQRLRSSSHGDEANTTALLKPVMGTEAAMTTTSSVAAIQKVSWTKVGEKEKKNGQVELEKVFLQ